MHILLSPGPVNVSPRVRAALGGPDICHREPEYFDLQDAIRTRLPGVFGAPTSFVDGKMFFGNDRLHFVELALKGELK